MKRITYVKRGLFCLFFIITGTGISQISVVVEPSKSNGVAPLGVFFDATNTSSANTNRPFHELHYQWNFGDETGQNWTSTGKSRNVATGPVAAHVYTQPGTYNATLSVTDSNGDNTTENITIQVSDPNLVFSGEHTICISANGDFLGCPDGAKQIITSSTNTISNELASGKRILLHRGEQWNSENSETLQTRSNGPGILGAYGEGVRPKINCINGSNGIYFWAAGPGWRIMDIELEGSQSGLAIVPKHDHLMYNMDIHDFQGGIVGGEENHCFVVNNQLRNFYGSGGGGIYMGGEQLVMQGNIVENVFNAEHSTRIPYAVKGVINNNQLKDPAVTKHALKFHGRCYQVGEYCLNEREITGQVVIADNEISARLQSADLAIAPQNSISDEFIQDIIVERNHFFHDGSEPAKTSLYISATDVTVRNNIFHNKNAGYYNAIGLDQRAVDPGSLPISERIHIVNNTLTLNGSTAGQLINIERANVANAIIVQNNLLATQSSNSENIRIMDPLQRPDDIIDDHNLLTDMSVFRVSDPDIPQDFQLMTGSVAIDSGTATVHAIDDYNITIRENGIYDIGAYEDNNTLGYDDINSYHDISFSNPVKEDLIITLKNPDIEIATLSIHNLFGASVFSIQLKEIHPSKTFVIRNLGHFTKGLYVLNIATNQAKYTRKIIINN